MLSRDLTAVLNTAIQHLVELRPLSVSMGNAIKFLKLQARPLWLSSWARPGGSAPAVRAHGQCHQAPQAADAHAKQPAPLGRPLCTAVFGAWLGGLRCNTESTWLYALNCKRPMGYALHEPAARSGHLTACDEAVINVFSCPAR